jgi:hypothetical protein
MTSARSPLCRPFSSGLSVQSRTPRDEALASDSYEDLVRSLKEAQSTRQERNEHCAARLWRTRLIQAVACTVTSQATIPNQAPAKNGQAADPLAISIAPSVAVSTQIRTALPPGADRS